MTPPERRTNAHSWRHRRESGELVRERRHGTLLHTLAESVVDWLER
jgi:hypothetical protein